MAERDKSIPTRRRGYQGAGSIEDIPLGYVHVIDCKYCGKRHEFISSYNTLMKDRYGNGLAQLRAIETCPQLSKRG